MKKLLIVTATFLFGITHALALNDTIGVTVGAGKTANLIKFGSNNVISETGVCDATTENQCASVSAGGAVKVDGSAVTQPISAASLPLPTGAATAAGLTTINTTLGSPFQVGGALAANQSVNLNQVAGSTLGAITTYGTSPGAVNVESVNAFVTNANANGPASAANSSPVVLAISGNSASAATGVTCGSAVSSCVLKNAAGNFYGVYAECTSACWLMVFNSASAPSNGATTAGTASGNMVECVDIAANSARSISYPVFPTNYSVGVTAVISSTACATLTLSTVGFIRGTVL
jgi:hypothetical protein